MSLTSFLAIPEAVAEVKPLRPKGPRSLGAPLRVEPRSRQTSIVGMAFDYLLRFELQRQAPHAVARPWVAEHVPEMLQLAHAGGVEIRVATPGGPPVPIPPPGGFKKAARRAGEVLRSARDALEEYRTLATPEAAHQASLAAHALRLAKLDLIFRAQVLDPDFADADPDDVEDLVALLAVVPFPALLNDRLMLLNPIFGESSHLVGGADTDLIAGDLLVDFKTVKEAKIRTDYLDQLLGYFLLARRERRHDPTFPEVRRVGLYFARHAHLWVMDTTTWTDHPEFSEIEEWFFEAAQEVFGESDLPEEVPE